MRDLNQIVVAQLPPANHDQTTNEWNHNDVDKCKKQLSALFLDDWPVPAKCDEDQMDDLLKLEVRKWRLQTLLAVQPFGIPSLALSLTYEKMFGTKFDLRDFGCDNLIPDLVTKMSDIMVVLEPDDTTPILFPKYPNDKILFDARLGRDLAKPNLDGDDLELVTSQKNDINDLICRAWLDRDLDFPEDAALVGEPVGEIAKVALAMVPGSRGLYRASIISTAGPDSIFIRLKTNDEIYERIRGLSNEVVEYFKQTKHPIDAYNVPEEFITLNFPCLLFSAVDRTWSRCIIIGRSRDDGKILVESIDFGGIYAVNKIFLYLIPRQFLVIPRLTFEVSLVGLKPTDGQSWSKSIGARMRCFTIPDYYLDILLLDPKSNSTIGLEIMDVVDDSSCDKLETQPTAENCLDKSGVEGKIMHQKKRRLANRATYNAIVVDRNDDDMDIYLDEVLALETYAHQETSLKEEISTMKQRLNKALENIPRPVNPLKSIDP